jgi:hypothetical protein
MLIPNPQSLIPTRALSQSFHEPIASAVPHNRCMRSLLPIGILAAAMAVIPYSTAAQEKAPVAAPSSIAGGWTRNADLSDAAPGRGQQGADSGQGQGNGGGGGGGRRRGGGGGGGFGGGGYGRGGGMGRGGGGAASNPDDVARMRDAMRDIMEPSEHLTITQTPTMVVITGADGRTTRLAPDSKKVKDENTKVERKTKWEGDRLVSEISGLGPGKMTQSFVVEAESHRLRVTVLTEGGRSGQPRTITHIYDADAR